MWRGRGYRIEVNLLPLFFAEKVKAYWLIEVEVFDVDFEKSLVLWEVDSMLATLLVFGIL